MAYVLESEDEFKRLEKQSNNKNYLLSDELKNIQFKNNDFILDAGCGSGLLSRHLLTLNSELKIDACDFSEIRIQQAKNHSSHDRIRFFQSSLDQIPVKNETYTKVFCR